MILQTNGDPLSNNQNTTSKPPTSIPTILKRLQKPQPDLCKTTTETEKAAPTRAGSITNPLKDLNDRGSLDLAHLSEERTKTKANFCLQENASSKKGQAQKIPSEKTDLILIGDYPVLRILPNDSDGTFRVTTQVFTQHNDPIEEQGVPASPVKGRRTGVDEIRVSNLGKINNDDDSLGWTLVNRRKKRNQDHAKQHWNTKESPLSLHARRLRQQQKCFKCLLKGHV